VACYWLDVLECDQSTTMSPPFSTSPFALAFSEPDVTSIAPHVFAAHEEQIARATAPQPQPITAEITFKPDISAFEMVTENRDAMSLLRALGPQAKITIHF
jgi:hypothetical protein